jgi:dolichol-phosphate mannosyltransferase
MEKQSWSVVVFCFNEVGAVEGVINKVLEVMGKMPLEAFEVVVVDDGSTDGSRELIARIAQQYATIKYVPHETNLGIGRALRTGYFNSKYENICAVPADGQFDIDELIPFAAVPQNEFVSFYRKENTTYSLARNLLSHANKVINQVFNGFYLLDVNWVKIYKREVIVGLGLELESSLVESEICAKLILSGYKPNQVVSKYLVRTSGESKGASGKIIFQAISDTYQLFKVLKRFRKKNKKA